MVIPMQKKVLITVGGTGGHVFPALALAQQLEEALPEIKIQFVGGKLNTNRYFDKGIFPYHSISCGSFSSKNPFSLGKSLYNIVKGIKQSKDLFKNFKPDLVIGFGSYHTLPSLLAAKLCKIPIVLHESNSIPGKVNRLISPYAVVTAVLFPDAIQSLKGHVVLSGVPLRKGFKKGSVSKQDALTYFGLTSVKPTLLVFGGSQGAKALNKVVLQAVDKELQVIHITGQEESVNELTEKYKQKGIDACVKGFETRMDLAWQASDFALCRAGSGTIAEALEFEVPCILIPYPFAADDHQKQNASFMVNTVGGGRILIEKDLKPHDLIEAFNDFKNGKKMRQAIEKYKANYGQTDFCSLIATLLRKETL